MIFAHPTHYSNVLLLLVIGLFESNQLPFWVCLCVPMWGYSRLSDDISTDSLLPAFPLPNCWGSELLLNVSKQIIPLWLNNKRLHWVDHRDTSLVSHWIETHRRVILCVAVVSLLGPSTIVSSFAIATAHHHHHYPLLLLFAVRIETAIVKWLFVVCVERVSGARTS